MKLIKLKQYLLNGISRRINELDVLLDDSTQGTTEHAMYKVKYSWNVFLYEALK